MVVFNHPTSIAAGAIAWVAVMGRAARGYCPDTTALRANAVSTLADAEGIQAGRGTGPVAQARILGAGLEPGPGQYIGSMMRYPESLIGFMRQDLTANGVAEARTAEDVDAALAPGSGTVLVITNSVCGCAAGKARPGVVRALAQAEVKPDLAITVFAGADLEAVARVREILTGYPPSSPSFALFRGGKPVYLMHRFQIEGRTAEAIAEDLTAAFAEYCAKQPS